MFFYISLIAILAALNEKDIYIYIYIYSLSSLPLSLSRVIFITKKGKKTLYHHCHIINTREEKEHPLPFEDAFYFSHQEQRSQQ